MTVLCLLEIDPDGVLDGSWRALGVAAGLADDAGVPLLAAWFGPPGAADAGRLHAAGVARGYAVEAAALTGYAPLAWARALLALAGEATATAVLAAATDRGNEVLAHAGALGDLPMVANCVAVTGTRPGTWRLTRQRWGGSLLEEAELTEGPALLTVAADSVPAADPGPGGEAAGPDRADVRSFTPELAEGDLSIQAAESAAAAGGASLATARIVIGGGRGVGGADGFAPLEELADLLGAVVGVSRVVTSQGWRPHQQQVGQTGTKIAPDLYLACGISGAIQHLAGCQGARTLIAVNTDEAAPIMSRADYAVIGDLHEVIPALVAALRARDS